MPTYSAAKTAIRGPKGQGNQQLISVASAQTCPLAANSGQSGTRSDSGRACRDAFLGLLLTCAKLGLSFWDYLGHRLGVPKAEAPYLPDLVRLRSAHA